MTEAKNNKAVEPEAAETKAETQAEAAAPAATQAEVVAPAAPAQAAAPAAQPAAAPAAQPATAQAAPVPPHAPGAPAAQAAAQPAPQAAPAGQPFGAVPPQAHPSFAQQPPQRPQNMPGMPLLYLTGGMKFGWAVVGLLMGPVAILLAWLVNLSNFPQAKSDAMKFALIGFLVNLVLWIFFLTACGAAIAVAVSQAGYSSYGGYGTYYGYY